MPRVKASKIKAKLKLYDVLCQAVESGVSYGYRRAFKYDDKPIEAHIVETISNEVMNGLCEWIDFDK